MTLKASPICVSLHTVSRSYTWTMPPRGSKTIVGSIREKLQKIPIKSMHKIDAELKFYFKTSRMAKHVDLNFKSYTKMPRYLITDSMKARKLERYKNEI